jgi:hypothetical protein
VKGVSVFSHDVIIRSIQSSISATSIPVFFVSFAHVLGVLPHPFLICTLYHSLLPYVIFSAPFQPHLQGHTGDITCLAFIADSYVVSGSRAGQLLVHGLQQGTLAATVTLKADAGTAVCDIDGLE